MSKHGGTKTDWPILLLLLALLLWVNVNSSRDES